jgi:hypothetical protein
MKEKRSSLFVRSFSDDEKIFYEIDALLLLFITALHHNTVGAFTFALPMIA